MVARDLRFVILGEDLTHVNFARRWLEAEGVPPRQLRVRAVAANATGEGGEKYVRQNYAAEVGYYRANANHQRVALVVVIDADTNRVDHRQRQLDAMIEDGGRQGKERIAILVPRRNIETWLTSLSGGMVDETTDLSSSFPRGAPEDCKAAGRAFAEFLGRQAVATDLPSLTAARPEVARLT